MNKTMILGGFSLFLLAAGVVTPVPADANVYREHTNAKTVRTVSHDQERMLRNLDARMTQMHNDVRSSENLHRISSEQAADLHSGLDKVASRERKFLDRDGQLSYGELQSLINDLNGIEQRMTLYVANGGPAAGFNRYYRSTDVDRRLSNLQFRIERGQKAGRLSPVEVDSLRTELDNITRLSMRMQSSGGGLNAWEISQLNSRMSQLASRVEAEAKDREFAYRWNGRTY